MIKCRGRMNRAMDGAKSCPSPGCSISSVLSRINEFISCRLRGLRSIVVPPQMGMLFFNKHRIFLPRSSCSDDRFVLVIQFSERPQCLETSYWRWYLNIAYECLDRRKLFPLSPFRHGLIYGSLLEVKPRQLTGHGSFKEGVLQIEEK